MAHIHEKVKNGGLVSCKFRACLGRDESGKQIFRCITWFPDEGLTIGKARKAAKIAAAVWEEELQQTARVNADDKHEQEIKAVSVSRPPRYTFDGFVNDVWLPLYLMDGSHRHTTIRFYTGILKITLPYFRGVPLTEITGIARLMLSAAFSCVYA